MEINENTEDKIKSVIDVQEYHRDQIKELSKVVDCIRATMMTSLRFELKEDMIKCVLRGYRTPEDTERIEAKYYDYVHRLQGNHGITHIYEHDFIKLPVKERPRRKLWNLFTK